MRLLDRVPTSRSTSKRKEKQQRMKAVLTPTSTTVPGLPPKGAKITDAGPMRGKKNSVLPSKELAGIKFHQHTPSFPRQAFTAGFTDPGPYVTLLVGKQDLGSRYLTPRHFHVPASTIQHAVKLSKYYAEAQAAVRSDVIIRLPELDPNAFELYYEYISTRTIEFPRRIGLGERSLKRRPWICCWPLINAHIFATTVRDFRFGRYVLGLLIDKLALREAPDTDTITHVFTARDVGKDLKAFVVNQTLADGLACFGPEQLSLYSATFLHAVLQKISKLFRTRRRETKKANGRSASVSSNQPDYYFEETLKLVRERVVHALIGRESHVARLDADANGISSIDWANPREAEQNRTLPRVSAITRSTSDPYVALLQASIHSISSQSVKTGMVSGAVSSISAVPSRKDAEPKSRAEEEAATTEASSALLPLREARDSAPDLRVGVKKEMSVDKEQRNGPRFDRQKSSKRTLILNTKPCSPIPEEDENNGQYLCSDKPQDTGDGIPGPMNTISALNVEADKTNGLDSVAPGAYPEPGTSSA